MENNSPSAPHLFQPLTVRSVTLRNRIGVSPMCQYSAEDGVANDWHFVHLGSRAVGGAGLVMVEATAVAPEGRITPGCLGLWAGNQIEPLACIAEFVKAHGAVAGIQIAHAGRKGSADLPWQGGAHLSEAQSGWPTIAPSAIPFGGDLPKVPHAMTEADIARVQNDFVAAAKRALSAGFEWLELHAAHGYLFNEFLSPLANHRTDQYGGSFENRTRFLLDTARAVRQVWPDHLPLAVRISAIDWMEGGWEIEQSIELAKLLKAAGVDLMDCSSGGVVPDAKITVVPGYQVPFAEKIRTARTSQRRPWVSSPNPNKPTTSCAAGRRTWCCSRGNSCAIPIGRYTPRKCWVTNCRRQINMRGHGNKIAVSMKWICCDNLMLISNREHFIRHF